MRGTTIVTMPIVAPNQGALASRIVASPDSARAPTRRPPLAGGAPRSPKPSGGLAGSALLALHLAFGLAWVWAPEEDRQHEAPRQQGKEGTTTTEVVEGHHEGGRGASASGGGTTRRRGQPHEETEGPPSPPDRSRAAAAVSTHGMRAARIKRDTTTQGEKGGWCHTANPNKRNTGPRCGAKSGKWAPRGAHKNKNKKQNNKKPKQDTSGQETTRQERKD